MNANSTSSAALLHAAPMGTSISLLPRTQHYLMGQSFAIEQATSLFTGNQFPHALILHGPDGVGKETFAFHLARYILFHKVNEKEWHQPQHWLSVAQNPNTQSSKLIAAGSHPDLSTIFCLSRSEYEDAESSIASPSSSAQTRAKKGTTKSKKTDKNPRNISNQYRHGEIKIDDIRQLSKFTQNHSLMSAHQCIIINHADQMNIKAANALLKTLEEPSGNTIIILVTSQIDRLLPTIKSRCQKIAFSPLDQQEMSGFLNNMKPLLDGKNVDETDPIALDLSKGSPGMLLRLFEEHHWIPIFQQLWHYMLDHTMHLQTNTGPHARKDLLTFLGQLSGESSGFFIMAMEYLYAQISQYLMGTPVIPPIQSLLEESAIKQLSKKHPETVLAALSSLFRVYDESIQLWGRKNTFHLDEISVMMEIICKMQKWSAHFAKSQ